MNASECARSTLEIGAPLVGHRTFWLPGSRAVRTEGKMFHAGIRNTSACTQSVDYQLVACSKVIQCMSNEKKKPVFHPGLGMMTR